MSKKLHFKLITHEKIVFENDVDEIYCKGLEGEFGILPDHTPFMSALAIGVTKVVSDGKADYFATVGGVFQDNNAVILTEEAENGKDIDFTVAKAEKEKLEARNGNPDNQKDIDNKNKALAIALAKFKAAMNETNQVKNAKILAIRMVRLDPYYVQRTSI